MKFGPASPREAIGGVTVHTLRQGALVLKKGTTIGAAEVEALEKAGVKEIVVVRLEQGDVSEDVAAAGIAQAEPSLLSDRLLDIAARFSALYARRDWTVVSDDAALSEARMALALATRHALVNGLSWLGIQVPDRM